MEHYERLGKIGEGTSGIVYKARDRRTGETVAIKRLRAAAAGDDDDDALDEAFRRELRCLEACRGHPCLVELRAAHRGPAGAFLVMEYAGRSLAEAMRQRQAQEEEDHRRRPPFPEAEAEAEARRVMRRLLEGAAAMHARGLLHRDLKPDNVLLDGRGGVKICDFGLSCARSSAAGAPPLTPGVATLWYRAPELILGATDYGAAVDAWALGCIMAELLAGAGKPLFPGRSEMDQLSRVFDTLGMQDMPSWPGFARLPRAGSPLCRRARPGASRLPELFPALSAAGLEVLAGLLACRPDRRLTAADTLRCPWFAEAPPPSPPAAATAAPEAVMPEQPRASCAAGFAAGGVAGVGAEAIVA